VNTFGKFICGKLGGKPFIDITRVNNSTGEWICPDPMVPCSTATEDDFTVCVNKNETADCPVTGLTFSKTVLDSKWIAAGSSNQIYGGYSLSYTKNINSNPIT
jgi:hypothetical protein